MIADNNQIAIGCNICRTNYDQQIVVNQKPKILIL